MTSTRGLRDSVIMPEKARECPERSGSREIPDNDFRYHLATLVRVLMVAGLSVDQCVSMRPIRVVERGDGSPSYISVKYESLEYEFHILPSGQGMTIILGVVFDKRFVEGSLFEELKRACICVTKELTGRSTAPPTEAIPALLDGEGVRALWELDGHVAPDFSQAGLNGNGGADPGGPAQGGNGMAANSGGNPTGEPQLAPEEQRILAVLSGPDVTDPSGFLTARQLAELAEIPGEKIKHLLMGLLSRGKVEIPSPCSTALSVRVSNGKWPVYLLMPQYRVALALTKLFGQKSFDPNNRKECGYPVNKEASVSVDLPDMTTQLVKVGMVADIGNGLYRMNRFTCITFPGAVLKEGTIHDLAQEAGLVLAPTTELAPAGAKSVPGVTEPVSVVPVTTRLNEQGGANGAPSSNGHSPVGLGKELNAQVIEMRTSLTTSLEDLADARRKKVHCTQVVATTGDGLATRNVAKDKSTCALLRSFARKAKRELKAAEKVEATSRTRLAALYGTYRLFAGEDELAQSVAKLLSEE